MAGPIEADETHVGGRRANMSKAKRKARKGRGPVDMTTVAGVKDRATNRVAAKVVRDTSAPTLQSFVRDHAGEAAVVYTDEHGAYRGLPRPRSGQPLGWRVCPGRRAHQRDRGPLVHGEARPQGRLPQALPEAPGSLHPSVRRRHNVREADTIEQMAVVAGWSGSASCTATSSRTTGWTPGRGLEHRAGGCEGARRYRSRLGTGSSPDCTTRIALIG